ncbi:MAG TPA: MBL fold metallo-hydrolase [Methylotenera sp.]|nr:MBL fold metallo-hydrolase [Methylotenera sp.]
MKDLYQLFDDASSTFTYVLVDTPSKEAVIIDPVDHNLEKYLALLAAENLKLKLVLETHAHADHITSAGSLCERTGAIAATPVHCNITPAEIQLEDDQEIYFGNGQRIKAMHTPGHTSGAMSFLWNDKLFTGDTLLINGCGRTDFQSGDAGALYDSITQKLFKLPNETLVYPGHDYHGKSFSSINQERHNNVRVAGKSREEFVAYMNNLHLPKPKMMDTAVPANLRLGLEIKHAAE